MFGRVNIIAFNVLCIPNTIYDFFGFRLDYFTFSSYTYSLVVVFLMIGILEIECKWDGINPFIPEVSTVEYSPISNSYS